MYIFGSIFFSFSFLGWKFVSSYLLLSFKLNQWKYVALINILFYKAQKHPYRIKKMGECARHPDPINIAFALH